MINEWEIEVKHSVIVSAQDIDDIICTAFEGGINYWCCEAEVVGDYLGEYASEQISRGGKIILHDSEEDETYMLTIDNFLFGLSKYLETNSSIIYKREIDTCQVDADVADAIIQYAIFGEIIYG